MADPAVETIADYVRPPYLTVDAGDPARTAYRRMQGDGVRSLVVVRDGRYMGIVEWQTIRDLSAIELAEPVVRHARQDLPLLATNTSIAEAMAAFDATDVAGLGLLPVVDAAGRLEGLIERDEFQGLMQDAPGEITVRVDPVRRLVSGPDVPQPGAAVRSSDGRKLGKFERYIEDRGRPRWMLVSHGIIRKKRRRVPLVAVERQSPDEVLLKIDRKTWLTFRDRIEDQGRD